MTTEKLHFKTSSGIKSIVGKDLITDKFVAIFELVKNSYDAGAKQVTITFDQDKITILDDGHGMSKDDLVEKWLNLAYSDKKEGKANNDRAFVGSKGIGRFSADRLGRKLRISTKIKSEKIYHRLEVDWDEFDKDLSKLFEKVDLDYSFNTSNKSTEESYTYIDITDLNENWTLEEIKKAKESLRRLKNPFLKDDGFKILVIDTNDLENPEEYIESNIAEVLKDKSVTVEAKFDENISICLFDRGVKIFEIESRNDSILKSCPIFISLNFLTLSAKMTFNRRMKVEVVNYGNLFIYKNDFRVLPYGSIDYDTFGLNLRKTQGYSRYLGTRELIGFIDIKDAENIYFKEASSRDTGFVNNIYSEKLKELYMEYVHRVLEYYVQLISWGEVKDNNSDLKEIKFEDASLSEIEKFKNYILKRGEIVFFKDNLNFEENKPEKKLERIVKNVSNEQKKEIEPLVKEVKKQVEDLKKVSNDQALRFQKQQKDIKALEHQNRNLSSRNRTSESYIEQITHHFTDLSERIYYDSADLLEIYNQIENQELKSGLISIISNLKGYIVELEDFKNILIDTSYDVKSAINNLDWLETSKWYFDRKLKSSRDFKVVISGDLNLKKWRRTSRILDLTMAYENFYKNAKEHGAKFLSFEFTSEKILISNDSKPIEEEFLLKIFDDGFSTKPNGTGIGLNQIKRFLDSQELSITIKNINGLVVFEVK